MIMENTKITLVLLPGLNGTAGLFDPLLSIASDKFALLVIDYPVDEIKSYAELTETVREKIRCIDGDFVLVGESFSGPIAIFLSANNLPGHIGTILVATFASGPYWSIARFLPWTWIYRLARPLYALRIKLSNGNNASLLKAASVEMQKVKPEVLAARTRAALAVDARAALAQIKIPLVYFRARYDFVVPVWNLKKITAIKPDTKVVSFNCQHFLLQSVPQAAWQAIDDFVREIRA